MESSWELEQRDLTFFSQVEVLFMGVYVIELGMRFFTLGIKCLDSSWVRRSLRKVESPQCCFS